MTLRGYGAFYTVLTSVRDAVAGELQSRGVLPQRAGVVPGAIAWDECDQCGLLALAATRFFLTDNFPIETTSTETGPGALLGGDLIVQLVRCAPQQVGGAMAPSAAALDASAQEVLDDAYSVLCATATELKRLYDEREIVNYMVRQQTFVGPAGACVGSELSFAVAVGK